MWTNGARQRKRCADEICDARLLRSGRRPSARSSVAALAEIVDDGKTGFVFEKDNPEDLSAKLERVITDPDLRNEIGLNAHNWVKETHSWKVISQRVIDVYQKLTEEK